MLSDPSDYHTMVCPSIRRLIGDRTTLAVMLALHRRRATRCPIPFGENTRYDLVLDRAGRSDPRSVQDGTDAGRGGASSRRRAPTLTSIATRNPRRHHYRAGRRIRGLLPRRRTASMSSRSGGSLASTGIPPGSRHRSTASESGIRFARGLRDRPRRVCVEAQQTDREESRPPNRPVYKSSYGRRVDRPGSTRGRRAGLARLGGPG